MTASSHRHLLVTSALPYANGAIHLGHALEHIQTDIWVRFQKSLGHHVVYVCGDDAHGTPVMISAEKQQCTAEELIKRIHQEHQRDLADLLVEYDNYYTTHSDENKTLAEFIFQQLQANGDISTRTIEQAYDPVKNMFLPDRFVKGTCPRCKTVDQYGDSCEACGATYLPSELIDPISTLSQTTPIQKQTEHCFFELNHYQGWLKQWLAEDHVPGPIRNKLLEWFNAGLSAWDISRDEPYFGFQIPGHPGKYFYVWLDAPIGYMASLKNLYQHRTDLLLTFDDYWKENSSAELHHFIGKDIVYFHALFWPAMLRGAGFRTPTSIHCHGFLTINGYKMSKSRGTFINVRDYLQCCDPEYLRYYFATKLNGGIEDVDLNFEDFINRVNSDLVGKVINIASRCAKFIEQYHQGQLGQHCPNLNLFDLFVTTGDEIANDYEMGDYAKAMRRIIELADHANRYIDEQKPWILAKQPERLQEVQEICTLGLNCFKVIMTYLKPVLPQTALRAESFLKCAQMTWESRQHYLMKQTIQPYQPLMTRLTKEQLLPLIPTPSVTVEQEKKKSATASAGSSTDTTRETKKVNDIDKIKDIISVEDFNKCDLRIARIDAAEKVEEAEKLLKLTLNLGAETRTVFAGIKPYVEPEEIIGKLTVMVANLAPRKMRFGVSEGMLIVAGDGQKIFLIEPNEGALPGMSVK